MYFKNSEFKDEKKSFTRVENACKNVSGFKELHTILVRKMSISGKSSSTYVNYCRNLANLALYFGVSPELLDNEQIEEYLHHLKKSNLSTSESTFKHTVYGLRYMYRVLGMNAKHIQLPSISQEKRLPVVMSREEVKCMLKTPNLLRHRLILAMLYGCGLRCSELCKLEIRDVDFNRKMVHVRQGKGRKDRYVPLSDHLVRGLKTYLDAEAPYKWLFNTAQGDAQGKPQPYSTSGVQFVVASTRKKAKMLKDITTHTFRHSYATHLLEDGLDIMSIKDLLGHTCIETTLVYLHVAQSGRVKPFSPLDKLYAK